MKKLFKSSVIFFVIVLLFSCRKNLEGPQWDTKILTPILSTNLKIKNLVDSSEHLTTNSENVISIVYQEELSRLENPLDSLVGLSIEPFSSVFTLDSLELEDVVFSQSIVLDSFKNVTNNFTISDGAGITQPILDLFNVGALPEFSGSQDISDLLKEAYLRQAFFRVEIQNNTEFEITNLTYEISNTEDDFPLISETIPVLGPGDDYLELKDLATEIGNTPVKGDITISVKNAVLSVPSDRTTSFFNYSDNLFFSGSITDIKVDSASAQFSAQEVINDGAVVDVSPGGSEKLTFAIIESGIVKLRAFSTLDTDISIEYSIENLQQNGEEFVLSDVIENDFSTSTNQKDKDFLFDNYEFDFTVPDATPARAYNSFRRHAIGNISATDGVQFLSLNDTLGVDVSVTEIKPSYVEGFVGQEVFNSSDTVDFESIPELEGNLDFTEISLQINFLNELGITPEVKINTLTSLNTKTGEVANYEGDKGPFSVSSATGDKSSFSGVSSTIDLNNAENLLSILPNKIIYDIDISINPNADTANPHFSDFLHSGASLISSIDAIIPFEIGENAQFSLMDTITFDDDNELEIPENFQEGTISIIAENSFPLEANFAILFLDNSGAIIDSLSSNQNLDAAEVNSETGQVITATKTKVDFENMSNSRLQDMLDAENVIFVASFETSPGNTVKILDTYTMSLQLVADFGYTIKN